MREEFEQTGRVWMRGALSAADLAGLEATLDTGHRPGARIEAGHPAMEQVANLPALQKIAQLWPGMIPVRLVSFSKGDGRNWSVPWHQDRVIAVKTRAEVPGFGNWSQKGDTWHCEPPEDILKQMLFLRLHLDANTADNGAMEIALGSHRKGLVSSDQAEAEARTCETEITVAAPGDILILSMLTLHRSRPAMVASPRRALRVDMSADALPDPLEWAV